jgi:hypothetical protein
VELRERATALNVSRWDKIFAASGPPQPPGVLADRGTISDRPWMRA